MPVQCKTGHAFIKERMRAEDAVYGGEMSAHHYFRDFAYCDSGMIPWLLVAELMCRTRQAAVGAGGRAHAPFPASGEINRRVDDAARRSPGASRRVSRADALTRRPHRRTVAWSSPTGASTCASSNTEPLVRLNVETRGDEALMQAQTAELLALLDTSAGAR